MSNSEEFENIIALLKEALKFYADQHNYNGPMGTIAPIDADEHGSQARFVLKQADDLIEQNRKMEEDYDRLMAAGEMLQTTEEKADPEKLMNLFKILGDERDNNV
jgi:hypothetical protein